MRRKTAGGGGAVAAGDGALALLQQHHDVLGTQLRQPAEGASSHRIGLRAVEGRCQLVGGE